MADGIQQAFVLLDDCVRVAANLEQRLPQGSYRHAVLCTHARAGDGGMEEGGKEDGGGRGRARALSLSR